MKIDVTDKNSVLFLEASFSFHPDKLELGVHATCSQDEERWKDGKHFEWHQYWGGPFTTTTLSKAGQLSSTERTLMRHNFELSASALETYILEQGNLKNGKKPVFVRVFDIDDALRMIDRPKKKEVAA